MVWYFCRGEVVAATGRWVRIVAHGVDPRTFGPLGNYGGYPSCPWTFAEVQLRENTRKGANALTVSPPVLPG